MTRIVKFETRYPVGKDPQDWVLVAPSGAAFEKTQTWHRVSSLKPREDLTKIEHESQMEQLSDTDKAQVARWMIVRGAYQAWKREEELPLDGTPLAAWSGVNERQAGILKSMGIRTIEDVVGMNEQTIGALRWPNARKLPGLAKKYLEGADGALKDQQIADMAERMAAMEAMLEETTSPKAKVKAKSEAA